MINKISCMQNVYNTQNNKLLQNKSETSFGMSIAIDYKRMRDGSLRSFFKTLKTFRQAKERINAETKGVAITISQPSKTEVRLLGLPEFEHLNETRLNMSHADFDDLETPIDYSKGIKIEDLSPETLYKKAIEVARAAESRFFL